MFVFDSFFWPVSTVATIGGLAFFSKLSKSTKWLLVSAVSANLFLNTVCSGKQKYLGDLMAIALGLSMIVYARSNILFRIRLLLISIGVMTFGLLACIFVLAMRYEAIGLSALDVNSRMHPLISVDLSHPLFDVLGFQAGFGVVSFLGYLCAGWYGLYLATQIDWFSTWGLGSSYTVQMLLKRLLGIDGIYEKTLAVRVGDEFGWDATKWHTVFTHLASDVGFIGSGIIVFGVTSIWAKSWIISIKRYEPSSILLFVWLTIGALFVVANNQLFHSPGMFFTSCILGIFFFKRSKRIKDQGLIAIPYKSVPSKRTLKLGSSAALR